MPDRPPLELAAEALQIRIKESIENLPFSTQVTAAAAQTKNGKPTIVSIIEVATVSQANDVEALLKESLTSTARKWKSSRSGELPSRQLIAVIPPDVKPRNWNTLADAPRMFFVLIRPTLDAADIEPVILPFNQQGSPTTLVMKGGGIKGLAYVGALEVLQEHCNFEHYVGTSAGAITAILLAAGYSSGELEQILKTKDFQDFFDASVYKWPLNLLIHQGLHPAHAFTDWMHKLLGEKLNSPTSVKLCELDYEVTVYASRKDKSALRFHSDDKATVAAHAARCSMSIPILFMPQSDQGFRTYDGGLQNNYPVQQLLKTDPDANFLGLYLGPRIYTPYRSRWVTGDLLAIWLEANDAEMLEHHRDRTVIIDPAPVGTLDFDLSADEKEYLLLCGKCGALEYLENESPRHQDVKEKLALLRPSVEASCKRRKRWRTIKRYCVYVSIFVCALLVAAGVLRLLSQIWRAISALILGVL